MTMSFGRRGRALVLVLACGVLTAGCGSGPGPSTIAPGTTGGSPPAIAPGTTGGSPPAIAPGTTEGRPPATAPGATGGRPPATAPGAPNEGGPTGNAPGSPILGLDLTDRRGCCRINDQPDTLTDALKEACGSDKLCVTLRTTVDRNLDQDVAACTIFEIDHPKPLRSGDTVTFVINRPCEEDVPTSESPPFSGPSESSAPAG